MRIGPRVVIVGSPGSGKSTFARKLAEATGLPLHHLDALYWAPGWIRRYANSEWRALQAALVSEPRWMIDGNYHSTLDIRIEAADTVILLDPGVWRCLYNILSRIRAYRPEERPDMADGCPELLDGALLWRVLSYPWQGRARVLSLARTHDKTLIRLRSRAAADEYIASLRG